MTQKPKARGPALAPLEHYATVLECPQAWWCRVVARPESSSAGPAHQEGGDRTVGPLGEALLRDRNGQARPVISETVSARARPRQLVAIGASAGGPSALATLLRGLPSTFAGALVIVQHVDARFAPGMADWLGQHCQLPVRLIRDGDAPQAGTVLVAGTNDHLLLERADRLVYSEEPRDEAYRPSVDVFFHSVCRHWPGGAIGVLLTGMGRDGAKGLKALRENGHYTIAQDKASSAVFGMPKAAIALDAACAVLPAEQIADRLTERLLISSRSDDHG